jgi:hypothetical protein
MVEAVHTSEKQVSVPADIRGFVFCTELKINAIKKSWSKVSFHY